MIVLSRPHLLRPPTAAPLTLVSKLSKHLVWRTFFDDEAVYSKQVKGGVGMDGVAK